MQNMPIGIFRGDDTDAFSYQTIVGTINTDLDLTGCRAVFRYLGFSVEFDPIPEDRKLTIVIPADETKKFPPGLGYASLRVYDSEGRLKTFSNRIMVFVATKTPMFGSDEFEVDFNVRASLEPLKFFVGPNPDDFDEYRGYLEKVIDRASAAKYGLTILLDAIDSDLGANDGVAATPVAVKAAYAAIIDKLTDDYYTAEQTEEAIDRVAAYYITYDAAGNPFPTYAALANATTVYSGGKVRTPTRNDYCVVLADETHDNAEYRYIYAVADGETTGSWQPQFPVEGVMTIDSTVTKNSQNPVASSGVWSALWGALASLPTGVSSLYDWCVSQLAGKVPTSRTVNGKALSSDVTLTGADIAVSGTDATKIDAALAGKATKADAALTPVIGWSVRHASLTEVQKAALYAEDTRAADNDYTVKVDIFGIPSGLFVGNYYCANVLVDGQTATFVDGSPAATSIWGPSGTVVATRTEAQGGYILGDQTDKPLASEAEAEALRQGKQSALTAQQLANIAAVPNKANDADVVHKTGDEAIAGVKTFSDYVRSQFFMAYNGDNTGSLYPDYIYFSAYGRTNYLTFPDSQQSDYPNVRYNGFDVLATRDYVQWATPYALGTPIVINTASSETVEGETVYYGAATLADRTANIVQVTAATALDELRITFPAATSGKVRDFGLRVEIGTGSAALAAPALVPVAPTGETIKIENNAAEIPALADGTATAKGVTLLYFSENAPGVFVVKGEQVEEVA